MIDLPKVDPNWSNLLLEEEINLKFVFSVTVMAGLFEELLFRGGMLNHLLDRYGDYTAIGISGVFFGLIHYMGVESWLQTGFAVIAGILFGLMYVRTESLWAVIIMHGFYNFLFSIYVIVTGPHQTYVNYMLGVICFIVGFLIVWRCFEIIMSSPGGPGRLCGEQAVISP